MVDLDGVSFVEFPGVRLDSCYVVLRHRTHLGVMSTVVSTKNLLDFTSPNTPVFDFGTTKNDGYDYTGLAQKGMFIRVIWYCGQVILMQTEE
ncbi:MAG: hypothetical protein IPG79_07410 [Saprospiraceae bacterium]|nr:hypothetical protein [Saprospiraceae bacterium]